MTATYAGLILLAFLLGIYIGKQPEAPIDVTSSLPLVYLPSRRQLRAWQQERGWASTQRSWRRR